MKSDETTFETTSCSATVGLQR